jgi:hypothetical protein
MHGPAKNRLHGYEAGWLTLLVGMGVATEQEAREAQQRVAQEAVREADVRRDRRRAARDRRRKRDAE